MGEIRPAGGDCLAQRRQRVGDVLLARGGLVGREFVLLGLDRAGAQAGPELGSGTSNFKRRRSDTLGANNAQLRRRLKFEVPDPVPPQTAAERYAGCQQRSTPPPFEV
jgi:hypothetical protein